MAAGYSSRDIVDDFLRYKLLKSGVNWRRAGGQRRHDAAASASSWRSARTMTSHRGVPPKDSEQGEEIDHVVMATADA